MAELETPTGETITAPDWFVDAVDEWGMSKREVALVGSQETVEVLAPRPMGDLPNQVSETSVGFIEAVMIFVKTPLEPFRLAVGDNPPPRDPWSMYPPTVAVPEGVDDLPFSKSERFDR